MALISMAAPYSCMLRNARREVFVRTEMHVLQFLWAAGTLGACIVIRAVGDDTGRYRKLKISSWISNGIRQVF